MNKHGLFDIYGAVHIPFWQTKAFYYGVIVTLGILLIVIAWLVIKRKKKPKLPLWTLAITDIEALKKDNLATASKGKEFYGALTGILKRYLHDRYAFDSIGKTDEELIEYLNKQQFSPEMAEMLQEIFLGVTIIKFANAQAAQEQIDRDMQRSVLFVKRTIPSDKK